MSDAESPAFTESSIVARWVRRLAAGSFMVRLIRDRAKRMHAEVNRISNAIEPLTSQRTHADADGWRMVEGSRLLARVEGTFGLLSVAWREAAIRTGLLAPVARDITALRAAERVRLCGWILFVAALTVGVWRAVESPMSWSIVFCALTMLAAAAVMKWNALIATAWIHRSRTGPPNARI